MVAIHISGDQPPKPVANRSVRITPGVLGNIRRWLAAAPVPPPFRVLDRFGFDKADLLPSHLPEIAAAARHVVALAGTPWRIRKIFLVGHTDSRGPAAYNVALGQRRALTVRMRLVAEIEKLRRGLSGSIRFVVQSMGASQPVATSTTAIGRARNRRVEVLLSRI